MRFAFWIPKATDTHSEYVTFTAFPLQQLLHESAWVLRHTYIVCLVSSQHRVDLPLIGPHIFKFILWKLVKMITFFPN